MFMSALRLTYGTCRDINLSVSKQVLHMNSEYTLYTISFLHNFSFYLFYFMPYIMFMLFCCSNTLYIHECISKG